MAEQGLSPKKRILDRVARAFGCITVLEGTAAITERAGRFNGILGPGLHRAHGRIKVKGILSLDKHLFESAIYGITKERAFVIVEGFIQYQPVEKKGFDWDLITQRLRHGFVPVVLSELLDMEVASVYEHKEKIEKELEDLLVTVAPAWGIEACKAVIVNTERIDPNAEENRQKLKWIRSPETYQVIRYTPDIEAIKLREEGKKKRKAKKITPIDEGKGDAMSKGSSVKSYLISIKNLIKLMKSFYWKSI